MSELIEKYFTGEISDEDKEKMFFSIESDPKLKEEFIQLQNIKGVTALYPQPGDEQWAEEAWLKFQNKTKVNKRRTIFLSFMKYAAVIVLAITAGFFISKQFITEKHDMMFSRIEVPVGQHIFLTLGDGSEVWLNSASTLQVSNEFGNKERRVYLDGEAFFSVAKNAELPFIVETNSCDIEALGTQFNVLSYSHISYFEANLIEGSVKVTMHNNNSDNVVLLPNEKAVIAGDQLQKQVSLAVNAASWKDGVITFEEESLSEIIMKLEAYYNVKFVVANTDALNGVYTAKFRTDSSVEEIISAMQKVNKFRYEINADGSIIYIQ